MSTGCDMKYARKPPRAIPMPMRTTPTMSARSAARPTYSAVPGSAPNSFNAPKVRSAVIATGPVCRYGDEAKNAAARGGSAAAYSPTTTGRPASSA